MNSGTFLRFTSLNHAPSETRRLLRDRFSRFLPSQRSSSVPPITQNVLSDELMLQLLSDRTERVQFPEKWVRRNPPEQIPSIHNIVAQYPGGDVFSSSPKSNVEHLIIVLIQRNWHFSDLHLSCRRPVLLPNIQSFFPTDFPGRFESHFPILKPLCDIIRALQIV